MINTMVALLMMMATACDDFLEEEVPGRLLEDEFYETDADAMQAVTGIYDMTSAHYFNSWASIYMVKTMLSDESNAGGSNDGDQKGYQDLDDFNIDSQNDKIRDTWKMLYFAIYRANKVINQLPGDTDIQQRLIAEAKTLRAINYFDLVTLWDAVPLVLEEIDPSSYTAVERAPVSEVYAAIEQDLTEAIPDLPLKSTYDLHNKFRVSKGVAQAMLGKAYLYQEKWPEAAAQFETVINSGVFELEPSVARVFSLEGEFGMESLFELSYTTAEAYDWGNFPWGQKPESNIHIQLMGPRADYYTKAPGDSLIGGWGFNVPTEKMYNAFVDAGDSQRRWINVMSVEELEAMGGNWTGEGLWDFEGYLRRKYGTFSTQTVPVGELNYTTNWRIIRYADVLLMAAEAQYRTGNEQKAREYLNMVRQRPGTDLPEVSASGEALFEAIVDERQLELAFEGHRFLDLVRWGKAAEELGPYGFESGKNEVLPIPINDIRSAGLEQNDGY